jgi:hypothetical protein
MARKKTFLLNHELIDGIRFLDAEKFKAIVCGLADIDERKNPDTKDPIALAFINFQKGFVLENIEKWEKKCIDINNAREQRADLVNDSDSNNENTDFSNEGDDSSNGNTDSNGENTDSNNENTDFSSVSVSVSVSDPVSENGSGVSPPISLPPFQNKNFPGTIDPPEKNYSAIFESVKIKWKEIIGQETKETLFTVPPPKREKFINTLKDYSLEDICTAIGNYCYARKHPDEFDVGSRVYGSLFGFLENGVCQFYKDEIVTANFRKRKNAR